MPEQKASPTPHAACDAAALFQRYTPGLHRYLTKRVRDPESVPDLMQDIFERLLQLLSTGEVVNPQGCLYGIALNRVREHWYSQARNRIEFSSEAVDAAGDRLEYSAPDDLALRLSLQQDLNEALSQLPPVHQAILLLIKRDGLTYAEVAAKTGLAVSTITKYLFEARAKVKMSLKSKAPGERDSHHGA